MEDKDTDEEVSGTEDEAGSGTAETEELEEEVGRRDRLEEIIGSKDKKPAEVVVRLMYEWMEVHGVDSTLQFLSADSTNSNTG